MEHKLHEGAATAVLVVHLTWLLWVALAALVTRGRRSLTVLHVVSLMWGIAVEVSPWPCPLTTLEQHFQHEADIKRRLSEARRESQKMRNVGTHSAPAYRVKREGAGQIVLLGPPNSGKSQLIRALTHAHPEVADYPFSTRMPVAGMMLFEDVQIQLVDLPPMSAAFMEPWLPQVIRSADLSLMVVDPSDADVLGEIDFILTTLDGWRILPPRLLIANKLDLPYATENFRAVEELYC